MKIKPRADSEKWIFLGLTIVVFAIWATCAYFAFGEGLFY
jgi:hypothetical protein